MAFIYNEPSHTFSEYLLIPGFTGPDCIPANVSLKTPLCKYRREESLNLFEYSSCFCNHAIRFK